jgi:hypothetical protein
MKKMTSWPNVRWYLDRNKWYRMLSWPNRKCYVDWKGCYRKHSRTIWSNMWYSSDDRGSCHDLVCGVLWIGADSKIMLSWPNLKCYEDWNGSDRKIPRPYASNMWIRTDDRGWCQDLIWCAIWIGTDVK